MKIDDKIRDEELQYDINRKVAKMSALSSGIIDKCEFLAGEEILPHDQRRVKEQAKLQEQTKNKLFFFSFQITKTIQG